MDFIKKYWHGFLILVAAILPLVHPIDPKIYAAIVGALGAYGILIKSSDPNQA